MIMKYLKPFNESTDDNFKEELQEFCEMNLAYLLDEGTEIQIVEQPGGYEGIHLIRILLDEPKKWDDIKDHMIPFLTRLQNQYDITDEVYKEMTLHKARHNNNGDIRLYIAFDDQESSRSYITNLVKNLIADNHAWPNTTIGDIRLYVKGYKTDKKGILTKIKSFFK
jgi:hypothetical protein